MRARLTYTRGELLASIHYHGGFDSDGNYLSPRNLHRWPAIQTWQRRLARDTGLGLIECPAELFGDFYPNLAQTRYLLRAGVRAPIIPILT